MPTNNFPQVFQEPEKSPPLNFETDFSVNSSPLDRDMPDTSSCTVNENLLPGLNARSVNESFPGRETDKRKRGGL